MIRSRRPISEDEAESHYTPEPTIAKFHGSNAFFRGIKGPFGSGKSSGCVMEIYWRALHQEAYKGVRRFSVVAVRNTQPELISTTMKSWKEWVPESICPINMRPPFTGRLEERLGDGTRLELEIIFLAMDQLEDVGRIKSLNVTMAWMNEASEIIDKQILDMLTVRVGRWPPKRWGGPSWRGVIADTNAPDNDHWWYKLAEVVRPAGYEFFNQPPAVLRLPKKTPDEPQQFVVNRGQRDGVPPAENLKNLDDDYYERLIPGKDENWIKVFLEAEYGTSLAGKPIYPEYRDAWHCPARNIESYGGLPLIIGQDFGLTPGCVLCQLTPRGQFVVLDELFGDNIGIRMFAESMLIPHLRNHYRESSAIIVGDPAGNQRDQTSTATCMQVLQELGLAVTTARTQDFLTRRESVSFFLNRAPDGLPGFQVSPKAVEVRRGFMGKYHYKQTRSLAGARFSESPEKNHPWSTLHDGLQYASMYAREGTPGSMNKAAAFGSSARTVVHHSVP